MVLVSELRPLMLACCCEVRVPVVAAFISMERRQKNQVCSLVCKSRSFHGDMHCSGGFVKSKTAQRKPVTNLYYWNDCQWLRSIDETSNGDAISANDHMRLAFPSMPP